VKGHPRLVARYNQLEYKITKHGVVHNLPIDEKGKTPKTYTPEFRDSIVNMPNRKNIIWYDDGMYQGGTKRGYNSVNLYDPNNKVIAVFRKDENGNYSQFTTTCEVTPLEEQHLFASNGNFVTEAVLKSQKAVTIINLIPNKNKDGV